MSIISSRKPPIAYCARCNEPFEENEEMAQTNQDEFWHIRCFVCAQCFRPFNEDNEYYEFGGRKYCEQDFQTLFAPCCHQCNVYIIGRFIRALNKCWHPNCFLCQRCQIPLADSGFVKSSKNNDPICHDCNALEKSANFKTKHTCFKCKSFIDDQEDGQPLRYRDETYHAYHFNCHSCGIELTPDARQLKDDLYCLKCHDKMGIPICGACRRPIEERVVTALGKHWHAEHFACTACERPFLGKRHFEVRGLAYCEAHYYQIFGHHCHVCKEIISGNVISALNKFYCMQHFNCQFCNVQLIANVSKFFDIESNPCCKKCYKKLPGSVRKRLAKEQKLEKKKLKEEARKQKSQQQLDVHQDIQAQFQKQSMTNEIQIS